MYKLLFVYLYLLEYFDMLVFCGGMLCDDVFVVFVNENFVFWGGSICVSEGFKMSNSLKVLRFFFCVVVMVVIN